MDLLSLLGKSPIGQKVIAESETLDVADRKRKVAQIAQLEARLQADLPGLVKTREQAEEKVRAAAAAHVAAEAALRAADLAERSARSSTDAAIATLRAQLRATASPRLDVFREEVFGLHQAARETRPESNTSKRQRGDRTVTTVHTTQPSIARRVAACLEVLQEIERVKLEALTPDELTARIAAMRASLPEIEEEEIERLPAEDSVA